MEKSWNFISYILWEPWELKKFIRAYYHQIPSLTVSLIYVGERGGSVVECRTPEREVRGLRPTAAVLCPWARHFTPRKYWLITQEAMAPSRHDWKIVYWDVKPQHNQPNHWFMLFSILDCVTMQMFTLSQVLSPQLYKIRPTKSSLVDYQTTWMRTRYDSFLFYKKIK